MRSILEVLGCLHQQQWFSALSSKPGRWRTVILLFLKEVSLFITYFICFYIKFHRLIQLASKRVWGQVLYHIFTVSIQNIHKFNWWWFFLWWWLNGHPQPVHRLTSLIISDNYELILRFLAAMSADERLVPGQENLHSGCPINYFSITTIILNQFSQGMPSYLIWFAIAYCISRLEARDWESLLQTCLPEI